MAYVKDSKVNLGASYNYADAVAEIADLVGVSAGSDGRLHLADVCRADKIKKWAKNKPIEASKTGGITANDRINANQGFNVSWNTAITNISSSLLDAISAAGYSWEYVKPTTYKRIRDFDGYDHTQNTTPFQAEGQTTDGIELAQTADDYNFLYCYWHQRPTEIQPVDMALFKDFQSTHAFKIGVVVKPPTGNANLHLVYNTMSDAQNDSWADAVDMPLSVSSIKHNVSKYLKLPKSSASSTSTWKALFVCVRINKATGDKAWIPLPTMRDVSFQVNNDAADVFIAWINYQEMKALRIEVPFYTNNVPAISEIRLTNLFLNFDFAGGAEAKFEAYYNGGVLYTATIDKNTAPIVGTGVVAGDLRIYSTSLTGAPRTVPIEDIVMYLSVKKGDSTIYYNLGEAATSSYGLRIPPATTARVGYTMKQIFGVLGEGNYEIVTLS